MPRYLLRLFAVTVCCGGFSLLVFLAIPRADANCVCQFTAITGVKIKHCQTNCSQSQTPCCACGVVSSQCRCCNPGTDCVGGTIMGVGVAGCVAPPPA